MTEEDIDFDNFEEKPKKDKIELLEKLHNKLEDGDTPSGLLQDVNMEGEITARVIDEDGNEKQVESQEFKI
jgi:hypothetical protein